MGGGVSEDRDGGWRGGGRDKRVEKDTCKSGTSRVAMGRNRVIHGHFDRRRKI